MLLVGSILALTNQRFVFKASETMLMLASPMDAKQAAPLFLKRSREDGVQQILEHLSVSLPLACNIAE